MMEESESGQKPGESGGRKGNHCLVQLNSNIIRWLRRYETNKEEKKAKAKVPGLTKKDKKHQTSNLHISVTAAAAELIF